MKEYHKINSVFKRDERTKRFIEGDWSTPELAYLAGNIWTWDEKIDGTNIRVEWTGKRGFGGRTDNASIPAHLFARLEELFSPERLSVALPDTNETTPITLYGEGFGSKIQKGGLYLGDKVDFILFDVRVGEWWLKREAVEDIAQRLDLRITPILGEGTLLEAIEKVRHGFQSTIGTAPAEGMVLRPKTHMNDRRGDRIITKVKTRDFK